MKVSIIIPIYKVEAYIVDCLNSVYAQTYDEIEVILVDDCSPDNSIEIATNKISKLQSKFDFKVIRHDHNRGLSAARNTGVEHATGDYLYFLDSDDELTTDCIQILVNSLANFSVKIDFVVAGFEVIGSNFNYPVRSNFLLDSNGLIIRDYLEFRWPVMACNKLINRGFFIDKDLWFEEGLLHEDELFSFKLACSSTSMIAISDKTYIYKIRDEGSITASKNEKNFESLLIINSYRFQKLKSIFIRDVSYQIHLRFILISTVGFLNSLKKSRLISESAKLYLYKKSIHLLFDSISFAHLPNIKNSIRLFYVILYRFVFCLNNYKQWFR